MKEYTISILRYKRDEKVKYWQDFKYTSESEFDTVITALKKINSQDIIYDINGNVAEKIAFECSCLQKKCGACALVINGRPKLGCDARLNDLGAFIKVEPLRKFNTICDLIVDRSILFENLKTLKLWLEDDAKINEKRRSLLYKASECIQCGLCLEVCPNFCNDNKFFGMNATILTTRLLSELDPVDRKIIAKLYQTHCYNGCAKSLACKDVCPRKIKTDEMLVNANLLALWKTK